jgi:hypothetical protein
VNEWRRQASGEKLDRYKASVAAGVRRFQQTEKGQLATARSNLAKLTGLPVEYLDPAAIEAKAQQVRLTRMCRALKKGR